MTMPDVTNVLRADIAGGARNRGPGPTAPIAAPAMPGADEAWTSAKATSRRRAITPGRLSLWLVPFAVLATLAGLTIALWRAELSLENHHLDPVSFTRRASTWILWGGLAGSVLTAGFVGLTLLLRSRDHEHTRRHLRALELLQGISSNILARLDAGATSLQSLCESARQLLSMDRAGIQLLHADSARLELLASAGDMPAELPRFYELSALPNIRWCLETGKVLIAEDVEQIGHPQNSALLSYFNVRSVILIPLLVQGEPIGFMTFNASTPRKFNETDRQLAELLGSQAAVILANSRLHQAQQSAVEKYKALVDQRELLFSTNASIYQTGDLEESLRRIAELAPIALGVDLCIVALSANFPDNVRVAAITPGVRTRIHVGKQFFCPAAERAFQRREICVFARAADDPQVAIVREGFPEMGSMACVPLSGRDGARIGVLGLIRRKEGVFSPEQLKMARMFSTRAAAAIENARQLKQIRRDAATKAMLLRELNHRVKNNLAGIVALLSIGQPEMPPAARRWLDRVTDRVRVMAGAHQLFVGDAESVSLANLVERTLSSLSVARTRGVDVRIEIGVAGNVELRSEQAISLAMALHELCYNAMVHGLSGKGGSMTLRARQAGPGRLAVDVIDTGNGDGKQSRDGDASDQGTGIGLELVRGLVSRELHGNFSFDTASGGGTVATVEFPLAGGHR